MAGPKVFFKSAVDRKSAFRKAVLKLTHVVGLESTILWPLRAEVKLHNKLPLILFLNPSQQIKRIC